MKFSASRLSEGNKIFPAQIHIEDSGITVKIPGFFSGESKYFDFKDIASVDVKAPLVGYSTITFYAGGTNISAHGFTSSEVKKIKQAIENGKLKGPSSSQGGFGMNTDNFETSSDSRADRIRAYAETDKIEREENALYPWRFDENFYNADSISKIVFPDIPEDIEKTILKIIRSGIDEIKKVINEKNESANNFEQPSMKNVFKTFGSTFDKVWAGDKNNNKKELTDCKYLAETCIDKATEGIRKLRRFEGSTVKMMVEDVTETLEELKTKWLPKLTDIKAR